jgi:tripartite-type tricarboxylate transporter receptor subunit TctC
MIVRLMTAALVGAAALVAGQAHAQDWPSKPVRIVAGFAPGGIADLGARLLAEQITRSSGQQAVVENRTGAAGTLGMDAVAKAAPDGTTLGLVLNGNLVINPFVQKSMPFDAMKDLVPVAMIGDAPQMIAMSTEVPAKTFKEFQALAKAKPKTYSYGSAGVGSLPHLSAAEFARLAGVDLVHVPYRGNAPAMVDLLAGRIHLISASIGTFRAGIEAGKLRILMSATRNRLPYSPDTPTSAEAGLPGYLMSVWIGVVAPAGTPAPIVAKLNGAITAGLKTAEAKAALDRFSSIIKTSTPAEFGDFIADQGKRWGALVKLAGAKIE